MFHYKHYFLGNLEWFNWPAGATGPAVPYYISLMNQCVNLTWNFHQSVYGFDSEHVFFNHLPFYVLVSCLFTCDNVLKALTLSMSSATTYLSRSWFPISSPVTVNFYD